MQSVFREVIRSVFLGAFLMLLLPAASFAETTECTVIDTIPTVITEQGVYCLKGNLATPMTTGNAIDIAVNNVTIDFNGFKLGGLEGGASSTAAGVHTYKVDNITLKNGNIRGFQTGVRILGGTGHQVIDSTFDGNFAIGIYSSGKTILKNNKIINTGGVTNIMVTAGIYIQYDTATGTMIDGNYIDGFHSDNLSIIGVRIAGANDVVVSKNIIRPGTTAESKSGIINSGLNTIIDGNIVRNADIGVLFYFTEGTCYLTNNKVVNSTTPYYLDGSNITFVDMGGNYPAVPQKRSLLVA